MRILFTGGSSFTGYWFIKALAGRGHEVFATFRRGPDDYDGVRALRVRELGAHCRPVWHCAFGSAEFLNLALSHRRWDLLCCHGAEVTGYRSPGFDPVAAAATNTANLRAVLSTMGEGGLKAVAATGSVFEADEGEGDAPLEAISPYGLSKTLTWQAFRFWCAQASVPLGKWTMPNPFGPFEEPRFTTYLARTWLGGGVAEVRTPDYVRDNVPITLLAPAYARFAEELAASRLAVRRNPGYYQGAQGEFARHVAAALEPRLGVACRVELARQTEFSEPLVRVNTERLDPASVGWDESAAWDGLAEWYLEHAR
jgi:nucleoside-diphosphate-sugar epimerase